MARGKQMVNMVSNPKVKQNAAILKWYSLYNSKYIEDLAKGKCTLFCVILYLGTLLVDCLVMERTVKQWVIKVRRSALKHFCGNPLSVVGQYIFHQACQEFWVNHNFPNCWQVEDESLKNRGENIWFVEILADALAINQNDVPFRWKNTCAVCLGHLWNFGWRNYRNFW